ncbi:MAG: hypothetical protein KKF43_03020, partial [Proteobacteria bacterium]|nr:hypothetical protein [Pseudomonadota bacterium]
GSQAAAPIFIAYMKEALKNAPVEQFPGMTSTVLAKQGSEESATDDEVPSRAEETFYPEDEGLKERTSTPQATSQQFFKNDLD